MWKGKRLLDFAKNKAEPTMTGDTQATKVFGLDASIQRPIIEKLESSQTSPSYG